MAHRSLLRRHCASSPATVGRVLCSRVWCVGVSCVRRVGEAQRRQGEHPRRASRRGGALPADDASTSRLTRPPFSADGSSSSSAGSTSLAERARADGR